MKRNLALAVSAGGMIAAVAGFVSVVEGDGERPESVAEIVAEARSGAPEETLDTLADGEVTFDERERAVARTAACAADRGLDVELRNSHDGAPTDLGFSAATLEEAEKSRLILEECKAAHLNDIHKVFGAQNRPDNEELSQGRVFFAQCMAESGIRVASDEVSESQMIIWAQSDDEQTRAANAFCVDRHYTAFGFWP